MTRASAWRAAAALTALQLAAAAGQEPPAAEARLDPVLGMRLLAREGGRPDWAPRGDWIAYDRPGSDGYSDLYVARPDLTLERCVTCDIWEFRKRHAGNPAWHPSGRYLVVQVEKPFRREGRPFPFMAVPGRNLGDDLWLVSTDGRSYWNLTNSEERGMRVLSPRFSREGDRLAWSERVASGDGAWGRWALRVARFDVDRRVPALKGVRTYRPGDQRLFYECHGFTADDRGVLFGANLIAGQPEQGLDLYVLRLESGELIRLTDSFGEWDRSARFAPNGRKLVWASGREIDARGYGVERRDISSDAPLDLWMMNADGSRAERLTRFNDPFSPNYSGRMMVVGAAWSPEGDRILVAAASVGALDPPSLYLLELSQPFGR